MAEKTSYNIDFEVSDKEIQKYVTILRENLKKIAIVIETIKFIEKPPYSLLRKYLNRMKEACQMSNDTVNP